LSAEQGQPAPLLVVAGEASGDLHAARLVTALAVHGAIAPFGLGGEELTAAGVDLVAESREISVVGITEALRILPRARQIFRLLLKEVERRRPAVALLVDFPDFNLRLARALRRRGVTVVYYISPQVWAWRRGRVRAIARDVDEMLVLFPFEQELYRRHGVAVRHVGHPLVDEVPQLPQVWDREPTPAGPLRLALLPGSRPSEIEALLPTMLAAAARIGSELTVTVRLIQASTVTAEHLAPHLATAAVPIEVVRHGRFEAIADSHLALCASGTATLEVGLIGTPLVVLYRLHRWTYLLARLLVRLPAFSRVNLVLGEQVAPELLQDVANPERVAREGLRLLRDEALRDQQRERLAGLRTRLGERGASSRAAAAVARHLFPPAAAGFAETVPAEAHE
jgi:lipid-A-disaccharide synthase